MENGKKFLDGLNELVLKEKRRLFDLKVCRIKNSYLVYEDK